MAIRTNTNPRHMDLQPEFRQLLMKNGMQAHVVSNGTAYQLIVQGHDSPMLTYNISQKQMLALTDWGTNSANKKAYSTFTSIVGNDFYMPKDFVHFRNANGRVAMGLHGYRIGIGEYGRFGRMGMPPPFLGWTPRNQEGFHLRRVGGQLFYPQAPMVAERWDKRMKPGELQSGGYGFYYKGQQRENVVIQQPSQDVLKDLQSIITPIVSRPRSQEPAKPYKELVGSDVYFSNEKWQECLISHGVIIDKDAKTLTIQSESINADMVYDLRDDELAKLTNNSIKNEPLEKRLEIINAIIKDDFAEGVDMNMLNSNERISIVLHPSVNEELQQRIEEEQSTFQGIEQTELHSHVVPDIDYNKATVIDGNDLTYLNENKGWYREGAHGREVQVDDIMVHPSETEGKYKMTAIINGEAISHEISTKEYNKFLAVDDYHRMKLFSKIFTEVDMKTHPEAKSNLGAKILGALTAGAVVTTGIIHGMNHHHHRPDFHEGPHMGPRPYFKPGVDTPRDVAARVFEAEMNKEIGEIRMGR